MLDENLGLFCLGLRCTLLLMEHGIPRGVFKDMQLMKSDMQTVKSDVQTANKKITSIEMTLENETNISIIAEGHAILNRRLDEAQKVEREREML